MVAILAWAFSGIGALCIPAVRSFLRKALNRLIRREFIPEGIDFQVRVVSPADYDRISEMANHYLGRGHGISAQSVELWTQKNNEAFLVIECRSSEKPNWHFCGYYSVIPVAPAAASLLKAGKVQDYDLTAQAVLSFDDTAASEVYIMDLMTDSKRCHNHNCCRIAGSFLIRRIKSFLVKLKARNPSIKTVFTIVASERGAQLAERSGFVRQRDFKSPFGWKLYETEIRNVR